MTHSDSAQGARAAVTLRGRWPGVRRVGRKDAAPPRKSVAGSRPKIVLGHCDTERDIYDVTVRDHPRRPMITVTDSSNRE